MDGIDFERGAAMMLKGLTVQYLLRRTRPRHLVAGEWILWHAAAGGVGLIALQWAKTLELRVIVESGKVKIDPPRRYPLADAAVAHRDLQPRATTGALVLIP